MNGFQRRREVKMQSILQTAIELFSARGIKDVSIAEIAEKANVSQVSIYNFFGSKDNLAKQVIYELMSEKTKWLKMFVESNIPFREKFEKMLAQKARDANKYSEEFRQSLPLDDSDIQNFIDEYYQKEMIPLLLKFIEQGKLEDCVRADLSTEAILLYFDVFKSLFIRKNLSTAVRSDLRSLFYYGLFGKPLIDG